MGNLVYSASTRLTASGQVHTAPCYLFDMVIGSDGVNNPTIAVYNEATSDKTAAKRVFPYQTYDALSFGLNGVILQFPKYLSEGLYVEIVNLGSGEVIIGSRLFSDVSMYTFR